MDEVPLKHAFIIRKTPLSRLLQKITAGPQAKKNFFLFEIYNSLTESTGTFIPYQEYMLLRIILFSIIQEFNFCREWFENSKFHRNDYSLSIVEIKEQD